ncbi:Endonuclease/exonuclease/phosphatase,Reverse transcriptase domain [Cinara cedri]|uniref:Endonuclease/exonuclease/phosphatase,Reverse transcriptase domain n=1 Tax=Cinara cedri TaxID=506608 RepID=A0A5E4MFT4_9HEMI|nr:Endonuclease/exonuclease/phosphatase,Reverse transcriptase domain [Cinara cedri]
MTSSKVKYSGGKIVPRSDLRVGTTEEEGNVKSWRRIATWNVRTMLQCGKLENLKIEMARMKMDILGLSEMRWPRAGDLWSGEYRLIHTGTAENNPGIGGVGIIMSKAIGKKVKGFVQYNERIILVKIETKLKDTIIVQVYMPTSNSSERELEEVYEGIEKVIEKVKGDENLIIMGDWNAVVGEESLGRIIGNYGLGNRNERGDRLIDFFSNHELLITNTYFKHHPRRRYTWKMPGDINRYQIDYIMVKKRFRNQVKDCRSYPGADIDSDHNLLMMKSNLKFKKIVSRKNNDRWHINKLKEEKANDKFKELTNDISINERTDINNRWGIIKSTVTEAASKTLKENKTTVPRKKWITTEIASMKEERRKLKNGTTFESQRKYRELRNLVIRKSKEAKETFLKEKCKKIEVQMRNGSRDAAYKSVKNFFNDYKPNRGAIEDNNGVIIYEDIQRGDVWKKYLEQLYEGPELTGQEIEHEEKKAAGIDEIQAELWKESGESMRSELFKLLKEIFNSGELPLNFTKCKIIPIPKKATANKCDQYRTISLLTHVSKILTIIILRRMEYTIEAILSEDQFGFRKNMGTREAILALRIIIEKRIRKDKPTYIAFVDIEKAFDNVNWAIMFKILKRAGEARIRKGVRQDCNLSPSIFNAYIQEAIDIIREKIQVGIKINDRKIDMLRFADDIAVIAENKEELQRMLRCMEETLLNELSMKINTQKTKVLVCSRNNNITTRIHLQNNQKIKKVEEFAYLGSIISKDGRSKKEIVKRICQAKIAFNKKSGLFTSKSISVRTRINLLMTYVWSIMLYDSET